MTFAKLYNEDCFKKLKKIKSESVDLIFADPPYNLQLKNKLIRPDASEVSEVNDYWDKFCSFKDYDKFTNEWIKECKRVLKKKWFDMGNWKLSQHFQSGKNNTR